MLKARDSHRLSVVAVLSLSRSLLHLFIGNLEAREAVPNDQPQPIRLRQFALVVNAKISGCAVVREVLRHHRIEIMPSPAHRSARSQNVLLPRLLHLSERTAGIEAAAVEHNLAMQ